LTLRIAPEKEQKSKEGIENPVEKGSSHGSTLNNVRPFGHPFLHYGQKVKNFPKAFVEKRRARNPRVASDNDRKTRG
jgi:hypothetical protein